MIAPLFTIEQGRKVWDAIYGPGGLYMPSGAPRTDRENDPDVIRAVLILVFFKKLRQLARDEGSSKPIQDQLGLLELELTKDLQARRGAA